MSISLCTLHTCIPACTPAKSTLDASVPMYLWISFLRFPPATVHARMHARTQLFVLQSMGHRALLRSLSAKHGRVARARRRTVLSDRGRSPTASGRSSPGPFDQSRRAPGAPGRPAAVADPRGCTDYGESYGSRAFLGLHGVKGDRGLLYGVIDIVYVWSLWSQVAKGSRHHK